jgi:hypothetical protein
VAQLVQMQWFPFDGVTTRRHIIVMLNEWSAKTDVAFLFVIRLGWTAYLGARVNWWLLTFC